MTTPDEVKRLARIYRNSGGDYAREELAYEALCSAIDALAAQAAPAAQPVAWRALADEMPEPEVFVLTWDGNKVGIDWWGSLRYRHGDNTTHWCPFPTPPGIEGRSMYGLHSVASPQADTQPSEQAKAQE